MQSPNDQEAARLAAEIARIEAELQAAQLQAEIAALQKQLQPPPQVVHQPRRPTRPVPSYSAANATPQAQADAELANRHREQLAQEIAAMERAIAEERQRTEGAQRLQLEEEIRQMEAAIAAATTSARPTRDPTETQRWQLEEEIRQMEAAIAAASTPSAPNAPPAAPPMRPNFLSSITHAAVTREQRLEETGGQLVMQEMEPEVEARAPTSPQLSTSMAEMVTKMARDREQRLANGGEQKMTVLKEKDEYKKDFSDICVEAAQLGRLTRLNEHVIEAVAAEKTPEQEWRSNGLLAIQWRSNHMSVIHEAAKLGAETKLPERVTSNCLEEEQDLKVDETSSRMRQLKEINKNAGAGQHKVDKLVMGRKEERGFDHMLVQPMYCYTNIDQVVLPRKAPPKIDPVKARKKLENEILEAERQHRPMLDISNEVATRAWERRARLDRPNMLPKVTEHCSCPYCIDPSPYQTYAYKVKEKRRREDGYESPEEVDPGRAERERRRVERLRRQHQQHGSGVENEKVGIADARAKFGPTRSQARQARSEQLISNMPDETNGTRQHGGDMSSSMHSETKSMDGSVGPRTPSGRVVRKVRRKPKPPLTDQEPAEPISESIPEEMPAQPDVEEPVPEPPKVPKPEASPRPPVQQQKPASIPTGATAPVDAGCACVIM